jgi:FkbM family methyltransferase
MSFRVWITRWRSYFSEISVLFFGKSELLGIFPKGSQFPVFLRRKTSDFFVYQENFMQQSAYDITLPFEPKLIIDCGGNIGLTSIFFAIKYPNSRIVSIEPDTANYNLLVKNLEPYKNVNTIKAGVWSKPTKLCITNPNVNAMSFRTNEITTDKTSDTTFYIDAISIEDILEREREMEIDLLKIDIEGAEAELFSTNYESWLPKTRVIVIELHDANCTKIVKSVLSQYKFNEMSFSESVGVYFNEKLLQNK